MITEVNITTLVDQRDRPRVGAAARTRGSLRTAQFRISNAEGKGDDR